MRTRHLARSTIGAGLLVLVGLAVVPAAAPAQQYPESLVRGRTVKVKKTEGATQRGELIAVSRDSLWIAGGDPTRLTTIPLSSVERVKLRRHSLGKTGLLWTLGGAVVTGGLLTAACSSVENAECGGVFPAMALSWGLIGGLSAASMADGGTVHLQPTADALRPYARFPQGMEPLSSEALRALPPRQ